MGKATDTSTGGGDIAQIEASVGPRPDELAGPVGWLLSPELVANLSRIFRTISDPRRWMWLDPGYTHVEDGSARGGRWATPPVRGDDRAPAAAIARTPELATVDAAVASEAASDPGDREVAPEPPSELWFDYAADIGDGVAAMYSTAYLLQADLRIVGGGALPGAAAVREARLAGQPIALEVVAPSTEPEPGRAPRGEFLFVGGDTAYHIADLPTVVTRVQAPFTWARRDLADLGLWDPRPRRIYGLPGNHDWYDQLDGFSRIFRRAAAVAPETFDDDDPHDLRRKRYDAARTVDLIGFERRQRASYVGISLPFGWQLWGLDIDQPMDERQRRYFRSLCQPDPVGRQPPARLVVCTPSPPVVFGKVMADDAHDDAMRAIGLPRLYAVEPRDPNPLPVGHCRLDLSGDVHHYARYPAPWDRLTSTAPPDADVSDPSYQCVVSGLGGAFLHPSDTSLGSHRPVPSTVFPPMASSRKDTARGTRWTTLLGGGWMRVVPVLLALLFSWIWLTDGMARSIGDWILAHLGFHDEERVLYTGSQPLHPVSGSDLGAFAWKIGVTLVGFGLLGLAYFFARRAALARARDPSRKRAYWLPTWFAVGGLGVLMVVPQLRGDTWRHGQTVDALVMLMLLILPFAAGLATYGILGANITGPRRGVGALFGTVHVAVQLVTMVILTRVGLAGAPWSLAAIALYLAANWLIAPRLATWSWSKSRTAAIAAAWLLLTFAMWTMIVLGAGHHAVYPEGALEFGVAIVVPAALAMLVGCAHFGWYLALMSALGYHNNELGGAARVDRYRQFIRFRVTADALTGYVIGLDTIIASKRSARGPQVGADLHPVLLDVFTIEPRPPTTTVDNPPSSPG